MAPSSSFSARSSSSSPPAGLVGGVIGVALALVLIIALLAFIFYRWHKVDNESGKRPKGQTNMREKFGISFKLAFPERLRLRNSSGAPRLKPLLSSFRPSDQYQSRTCVGDRHQAANHDPESCGNDTQETSIVPVTAPPFLGSRSERPMYKTPTPLVRDGARSSTLPLTRDVSSNTPNSTVTVTLPQPRPASLAESTFTLTQYAPSLIIPDSPTSSSVVPSSQGTPDSSDKPGETSTRSFRRNSPESVWSQRSASTSTLHVRLDSSTIPPVPPFPGRSDTVVVRNLLRDRVGRTDNVISRAFSQSSHIERADSITSLPLEGEPIAGPSTRSVRKKSNKSDHGSSDNKPGKAEPNHATVPSRPNAPAPSSKREPGLSRRFDAVSTLPLEPHALQAPNSAPPVPSHSYDDVLDFYATTAPLSISKVRLSQSGMPPVPPRAMVMGPRPQLSKPSAMAPLRVGSSSSRNSLL